MSATLKLFKKAQTWQADPATLSMTKPLVVETAAPPARSAEIPKRSADCPGQWHGNGPRLQLRSEQ